MAQQTAIDWFVNKVFGKNGLIIYAEIIQEAKEMEKEQIMNAIDRGFDEGCKFPEDISLNDAEQYYNETYQSRQDKADK
jgi:hypothetical protein